LFKRKPGGNANMTFGEKSTISPDFAISDGNLNLVTYFMGAAVLKFTTPTSGTVRFDELYQAPTGHIQGLVASFSDYSQLYAANTLSVHFTISLPGSTCTMRVQAEYHGGP